MKSKAQISFNMSQVKARGSKIEKILASELRRNGLKYRGQRKDVYGKPDFVLKGHKIAIFCDSHFWHGYKWAEKKKEHKSNQDFWFKKIERNMERDKEVNRELRKRGWKVVRFWEHQIKKSPEKCIYKLQKIIEADSVQTTIQSTPKKKTKSKKKMKQFKIIDLFAGIGGFHSAFHDLGAECVFASEWDLPARRTYYENWKDVTPDLFMNNCFYGDIKRVTRDAETIANTIPNFDILCAGFPCQPFSQAGFKKGFKEDRGTLFSDIVKIIDVKRPAAFFLENVRHLFNHDNGRTFKIIQETIEGKLEYSFYPKIVKASDFGLPQHRPRLFMVGFKNKKTSFDYPEPEPLITTMSDIWGGECDREIGYTLRVGGRSSGVGDRRNWDGYMVNGKEKRLSPREGLRMMGFPRGFRFPETVSETQAMKQLGNSVAVPAIKATAEKILEALS